ncbi:MAG: hypothetical protein ACYC0V_07655 [Armatimonadota bacterium]
MKLYGYSEIPNITQYLHLGYTSAAFIETRNDMGEAQFIKGGLCSLVIGIIISLIVRQRSRILFRFGILASAVGVIGLFIALLMNLNLISGGSKAAEMDGAIVRVTGTVSPKIDKPVNAGNTVPTDRGAIKNE